MAGVIAWDAWPAAVHGRPPPAMPVSGFVSVLLLVGQFGFGLMAVVVGMVSRK